MNTHFDSWICHHFIHNGALLAQSVEHETFNLRVVGSSPTLGADYDLCRNFVCYNGVFVTAGLVIMSGVPL